MKKVMTVQEFCRFMPFTPDQANDLISYGTLKAVRFGRERLITMDSVSALICSIEAWAEADEEDAEDLFAVQKLSVIAK